MLSLVGNISAVTVLQRHQHGFMYGACKGEILVLEEKVNLEQLSKTPQSTMSQQIKKLHLDICLIFKEMSYSLGNVL